MERVLLSFMRGDCVVVRNKMFAKETWSGRRQSGVLVFIGSIIVFCACSLCLTGCDGNKEEQISTVTEGETVPNASQEKEPAADAVKFNLQLDEYQPEKKHYNFYFTYKLVHPWWDAVALGMEDAAKQYEQMGITINYEYLAPNEVSAKDQIKRLSEAASGEFDVIGVDVADVGAVTPVINRLIKEGHKVMTFSSSDAPKEAGCDRIAYVGNTHNYKDGVDLTEALCKKLGHRGKVAVLVGTSNPVGAARAVVEAGREDEIVIVGMDHDQEALRYLRDGVIYALGVQDCYSIGFDTVQVAVKIADGQLPGDAYPEKTEEITTILYQDSAAAMLQMLYGDIAEEP